MDPNAIDSADERTPLIRSPPSRRTTVGSGPPSRLTSESGRPDQISRLQSERFRSTSERSERSRTTSDIGNRERTRTVSDIGPRERTFSASDVEVELDGCAGSYFCHPQKFGHRFLALALMCLLGFGSYYCMDGPGALQKQMKQAMDINTAQFANLYAWYNWPNAVLPIIGGFLMDRVMGIRLGTVVFSIFILLGQGVFSLGGFLNTFWVMEIGRFIFGIGGESLAVAQNTYAVSWFKGKELNMVFGFQLSIARVGATVNFLVMGPLYDMIHDPTVTRDYTAIGLALLIGGSSCVMSFICSLLLGWMDKRREKLLRLDMLDTGEVIKITDVKTFPLSFWFLSLACLAYYSAIFPFISLGQEFFIDTFNYTSKEASNIIALPYLVSAPASPVLGLLIDKTGRNVSWCFLSVIVSAGCHALLAFKIFSPYIAIVILGVAYSLLASALWPIAALVIPEHQLGTAYGLMQAIQNLGLGLITLAAGIIVDEHGYFWLEIFFLFWLFVATMSIICVWICDCAGNGYLNMSIGRREKYDEAAAEEALARARAARQQHALLQPRTNFSLRNRYLSRIGATLPGHLGHSKLIVPNHDHRFM